jgi:hypothetical protein
MPEAPRVRHVRVSGRALLSALALLFAACRIERVAPPIDSGATVEPRCASAAYVGGPCVLYGPSMTQLLARPELFDGRAIRVVGFLHLEFEGDQLYLSHESWQHALGAESVWIEAPPGPELRHGYAIVEGIFDARSLGHMGVSSGTIRHVTRLQPWRAIATDSTGRDAGTRRDSIPIISLTPGPP